MKTLFVSAETDPRETRVAVTPADAKKLGKLGWAVKVCRGAGVKAGFSDAQYSEAGAEIADSGEAGAADFVVGVRKPSADDVAKLKKGSFHLSLMVSSEGRTEAAWPASVAAPATTGSSGLFIRDFMERDDGCRAARLRGARAEEASSAAASAG